MRASPIRTSRPLACAQEVLNNLGISQLVFRSEADADVAPHVHARRVDTLLVPRSNQAAALREPLLAVLGETLGHLMRVQVRAVVAAVAGGGWGGSALGAHGEQQS